MLQPVTVGSQASPSAARISLPPADEMVQVEPKNDELLLTVDEEERIEQVSSQCARILDDLTDLQFEQQDDIKKEKQEFQLIKDEVDQVASKQASCAFLSSLPSFSANIHSDRRRIDFTGSRRDVLS